MPQGENLTPASVRTGFYPSFLAPRLGDLGKSLTVSEPFLGARKGRKGRADFPALLGRNVRQQAGLA